MDEDWVIRNTYKSNMPEEYFFLLMQNWKFPKKVA